MKTTLEITCIVDQAYLAGVEPGTLSSKRSTSSRLPTYLELNQGTSAPNEVQIADYLTRVEPGTLSSKQTNKTVRLFVLQLTTLIMYDLIICP